MSFGNSVCADSYSKFVVLLTGVSGLDWWFSEVKTGWSMRQNNNMKGGHSGQQTSWGYANPHLHSVICAVKTKERDWFLCDVEYQQGVYLRHQLTGKGIREEEDNFFWLVWMKSWCCSCPITFRTSTYLQKSIKLMRKNTEYFVFVLVSVILFLLSGLKVVEGLSMLDVDCTLVFTRIKQNYSSSNPLQCSVALTAAQPRKHCAINKSTISDL